MATEDIFKKFAITMGLKWDEAAGDVLEDKITELCDKLAPELAGLSTSLTGNLDEFNTAFSGLSENALKAMQEVANNSDLMDQIGSSLGLTDLVNMPKLRELVGTGSKEMVDEVFKAFQGYPELLDEITNGSKTLEDGLGELYAFLPKLGKGVSELDVNWSKSDSERYSLVERNLGMQLKAYERMREGLIEAGTLINAPSLEGLDPTDKARVLQQEMENLKASVQGVAKQFESPLIKGEGAGLVGQISGTIKQFNVMRAMSKEGLMDPAFTKNMGITGHLFRALSAGMGETGGAMAKVKAFTSVLGDGFSTMGNQMFLAWVKGTLGIAAVIAALVMIAALIAKVAIAAIDYRETLKGVDQLYGGMGDKLLDYSEDLRTANREVLQLGLSWESVAGTSMAFMKQGIDAHRSTGKEIIQTSLMMSKAFGMSEEAAAGFIGKLMISNKISERGVVIMGNQIAHAKQLSKDLNMAPIQMEKLQEAIENSSEAFSLAKSKGEGFTRSLTNDMAGLTAMTTALGLSASNMAKKMEEASNMITSTDSKFRNLLIISGGASVHQLMTGEVNRSQAMMATVEKLQQFGRQFGGNLHLASQMAEKVFGVSKDEALKMMNMTQEEKRKQQELMAGLAKLTGGKLKESYDNVTGTIMESWTKFKNVLMGIWMQIVSNKDLAKAFDAIGKKLTGLMEFVASEKVQAIIKTLSDKIGTLVAKIPAFIDKIMLNFGPWMESLIKWIESFGKDESSLGDKVGDWIWEMIGKIFVNLELKFLKFMYFELPILLIKGLWWLVKTVIEGLFDLTVFMFYGLPKLLAEIITKILTGAFNAIYDYFLGIDFAGIPKKVSEFFKDALQKIWDNVKLIFKFFTDPTFALETTSKIADSIWNLLKAIVEAIYNKLKFWKSGGSEKEVSKDKQVAALSKEQEEGFAQRNKVEDLKSERMNGMKDTDVIYDNGVWKYAGEKRQEIEDEKMKIMDEQTRLLGIIAGNTKEGKAAAAQQAQRANQPGPANKGNGSPVKGGEPVTVY